VTLPLLLAGLAIVCVAVVIVLIERRRAAPRTPSRGAPSRDLERAARPHAAEPPTGGLAARVRTLLGDGATDVSWNELEALLVKADVGPRGAADLVGRVRDRFQAGSDPAGVLRQEVVAILGPDEDLHMAPDKLAVILIVGVNGSGKTTTIGKLAKHLAGLGHTVSLAASDTFRAAAGEQLDVWAKRAGAHIVAQQRGADPGAVAFDAVAAATARGSDVLIVDTAGRLHTKTPLMDELAKVKRVIEKAGAEVDETLLVLDATTGQNGISQARAFTGSVELTGVVLTKMDGSAKGGVVIAVHEELGVPVRFVGVGEGADDIRPFSAEAFADGLLRS
jgi:fused signal recognition particle receptor